MRITSTLSLAVALTFTVSATAQMSTYSTFGTAEAMGEGCVELTTGEEGSAGAVWANELIDLTQPFHLQARINFGSVPHGAEGVVWALFPDTPLKPQLATPASTWRLAWSLTPARKWNTATLPRTTLP